MADPISSSGNFPISMRLTTIPGFADPPPLSPPLGKGGTEGGLSFQNLLLNSLSQTAAMEQSAQAAIAESISGGDITQVEVFSAVKKADLSLRMMLQMRNKILDAFEEIKQLRM